MALSPIGPGGAGLGAESIGHARADKTAQAPFARAVSGLLGEANAQQIQADQSIQQMALGQATNLHDVMLAVAKADLSFRMVLEVRNRLVEAYQEVMRMQV